MTPEDLAFKCTCSIYGRSAHCERHKKLTEREELLVKAATERAIQKANAYSNAACSEIAWAAKTIARDIGED